MKRFCLPAENRSMNRSTNVLRRIARLGGPLLLFTLLLFYSFTLTHAQTFDYNRAYQDYLYSFNLYRTSHTNYVTAKSEYLAYKTLTSETRAIEATRETLKTRSEALRTYLTALRMKLAETTGILDYQQNLQYLKLDNETAWLDSHQDSLSSPGSLGDLTKQSSQLEKRYPNTELLAYQTLGTILSGKENSLREKVSAQIDAAGEQLTKMKEEGENVDTFERWVLEARKKVTLSEEKQTEAEKIISSIKDSDNEKRKKFNQAQFTYEEANQYLKEAVSFLSEIIRGIKHD